jgi:uncharacterized membrane protein YhaH (DUF805 family)
MANALSAHWQTASRGDGHVVTFSEAIRDGFSKYVTFSGRSSRAAYWWWYLFTVLVSGAAWLIDVLLGTWFIIGALASLVLFLPTLAVTVRRFHDAGHSGWWVLTWIIPLVGFIVTLIFALTPSKPPNEWGEVPNTPVAA